MGEAPAEQIANPPCNSGIGIEMVEPECARASSSGLTGQGEERVMVETDLRLEAEGDRACATPRLPTQCRAR